VSSAQIIAIMASCVAAAAVTGGYILVRRWLGSSQSARPRAAVPPRRAVPAQPSARELAAADRKIRENWRMPPLAMLATVQMSVGRRVGMAAMWIYLGVAIALVVVRVIELALGH